MNRPADVAAVWQNRARDWQWAGGWLGSGPPKPRVARIQVPLAIVRIVKYPRVSAGTTRRAGLRGQPLN